mmetsp:Transcript_96381/g.171312  ORF Transcript_96381/g.171312 Transcript_96381/m.171312 type:complete len:483 (+) Transcript_96381:106-1554(+)
MRVGLISYLCFFSCHLLGASCPQDWLPDRTADELRCYRLVSQGTFRECLDLCAALDASLACVRDQDSNYYLSWLAADKRVWIGLSDRYSQGDFQWIAKECNSSYTNWAKGEPDEETGNCVYMREQDSGWEHGRWEDEGCEGRLSCLCERGLSLKDTFASLNFNESTEAADIDDQELESTQVATQETYWTNTGTGSLRWDHFVVEQSCSEGKPINTTEACETALVKYRLVCGGRDGHVQVDTWDGAPGCQIHKRLGSGFVDFQFNTQLIGHGTEDHFAVCYVPHASEYALCLREMEQDTERQNVANVEGEGVDSNILLVLLASICSLVVFACGILGLYHSYHRCSKRRTVSEQKYNVRVQTVNVVVPEGASAGQTIEVQVGSRLVDATIPPGLPPGSIFRVAALDQSQDGVQVIGTPVQGRPDRDVEVDTQPQIEPELVVGTPVVGLRAGIPQPSLAPELSSEEMNGPELRSTPPGQRSVASI